MSKRLLRFLAAVVAAAACPAFQSCSDGTRTFVLLTDRSELAVAAEAFAAVHPEIRTVFRYAPVLDSRSVGESGADLVIGSGLNAEPTLRLMKPLERTAAVYPNLEASPLRGGRVPLVPLSFELPILITSKGGAAALPDRLMLTEDQIRAAAKTLDKRADGGAWVRMGFSPAWDGRFVLDLIAMRYPEAFADGPDAADENHLEDVIEDVRRWIEEDLGGLEAERAFDARYRYVPDEVLIREGRILFARSDLGTWGRLPDAVTSGLDFRYLSDKRTIPVTDVAYAGILSSGPEGRAASLFLDWLLLPGTQDALMERWEREGLDVFGFLGGLSSLPAVNESILIRHFPSMEGKVPEGHYFAPPPVLPDRWARIRDEVVVPWLTEEVTGNDPGPLEQRYRAWDLSSLDEGP